MDFRTAHSPQVRVHPDPGETSMTKQSFKESCDINNILARYQKTGVVDHVAKHGANYGFISGATFTENMMQITNAQNMFNDLPAAAREYFNHDPAKFLEAVENLDDSSDLTKLVELGLVNKPIPPVGVQPENVPQDEPETTTTVEKE